MSTNILDDLLGGAPAPKPDTTALIRAALRYDYGLIPAGQRDQVQAAAVEIVRHGRQAQENLIEVGKRLIEVKALLEHGQFADWCETEFQMSARTVQNMMNVARAFDGKSETVSLLTDSTLYLLAAPSTPAAAREKVIGQAQATGQSPTKAQVKAVIAEHKPAPPVSPEQRQYAAAAPAISLDDLPVADSITVRVGADGKPNMDWEPEEWEDAQKRMRSAFPAGLAAIQTDTNTITAPAWVPPGIPGARTPAPKPGELPADLAAHGWELRRVGGVGRWYCNNPTGPRATGIFDKPEDAIREAYTMQVDLRAAPVAVAVAGEPTPVAQMHSIRSDDRAYERIGNAMADLHLAKNTIADSRPLVAQALDRAIRILSDEVLGVWGQP